MSVKVTVEMRVSGIDDPEAVEDALAKRSGYWRDEIGDALWQACKESGLTISDADVLRVRFEVEEPETQLGSNG
jgi:hypothetical protein